MTDTKKLDALAVQFERDLSNILFDYKDSVTTHTVTMDRILDLILDYIEDNNNTNGEY